MVPLGIWTVGLQSPHSTGAGFPAGLLGPHRIRVRTLLHPAQTQSEHPTCLVRIADDLCRHADPRVHADTDERARGGVAGMVSESRKSNLIVWLSELLRKLHYFALRPAPIVVGAVTLADESTVAAVRGFDVSNVPVGKQRLTGRRQNADEVIIARVDYQRGPCNPVDHVGRGRPVVIVVGPGETAIVGGYTIVEASKSFNSTQARAIEAARKQFHLAAKPPEQLQQKVIFI